MSINKNGSIKTFPKSAVKTYYSEKFDTGKTVWTVLGVVDELSVLKLV
ncbi:MAG: hypothetical protein IPH97_17570 [Ignavibacteriales bacterium]|nr:hypothetical protein [Ignavibacteriales bacterium]